MKTNKNTTVRYNTATHLTSDTGDDSALMNHELKAQLEIMTEKHRNQANIIGGLDDEISGLIAEAERSSIEILNLRARFFDAISERNAAEQALEAARALLREQECISDDTGASVSVFDHLANVIKERDAQAKQVAYLNWHVGQFTDNAERDAEQIKTLTRERDKYQHAYQQQKQAEQYRADNGMPEAVRSTVDELQGNLRRAFKELAQEQADHKATSSVLEVLRSNMRDIQCMVNDSIGEDE
jgi:hypothetical protein